MSNTVENHGKPDLDCLPTKPSTTSAATATDIDSDGNSDGENGAVDTIRRFFSKTLHIGAGTTSAKEDATVDKVIPELTIEGLLSYWREHGFKHIVTMVGAGISTSAGIPDFRSPGTGLYHNLEKYKLPQPMSIFDLDYFKNNPAPFFVLAKELYPGGFLPTPAHYFVRLLHEKGVLQRHYTQNIDTLDRLAGLPEEKIIEAHGSFHTNHCLDCRHEYDMAWMKNIIFSDKLPTCDYCKGIVKPDIVFFGESLPACFYNSPDEDFEHCDLLIIMGTSLEVQPFASLIHRVGPRCVRLLINRDAVGRSSFWMDANESSLLYGRSKNTRDVAFLGDCDAGVWALAEALGWKDELQLLFTRGQEQISQLYNEPANSEDTDSGQEDGWESEAATASARD